MCLPWRVLMLGLLLAQPPIRRAQMRNMARAMTDQEIEEVAVFYARKAAPEGH